MPSDVSMSPTVGAKEVVEKYRQIASAALADAETWLQQGALSRAIPEALPDAIVVADDAGIIVSVNAQFELMFGYHRSEVIGCTPEMLLPEALRSRHIRVRQGYTDHPKVRHMADGAKIMARRKNGAEFSVLINLGPVVIPAGIYTIVVIRRVQD